MIHIPSLILGISIPFSIALYWSIYMMWSKKRKKKLDAALHILISKYFCVDVDSYAYIQNYTVHNTMCFINSLYEKINEANEVYHQESAVIEAKNLLKK